MPGRFFDSNVLIYLASGDAVKAQRAEDLVAAGGTISLQVCNEVANVLRRKARLPWSEVHVFLQSLRGLLRVIPVTIETHELGLGLAERIGLSIYDAMIVAAASIDGCDVVWSEDMHDGLRLGEGLSIRNPFR